MFIIDSGGSVKELAYLISGREMPSNTNVILPPQPATRKRGKNTW